MFSYRTKNKRRPESSHTRETRGKSHRRAGRQRRRADIEITMPTTTPASAPSAAERRRGLKPSKKTKGNDGASKGGATTGADKSRAPKGKRTGRSPPSPERKNLESNKRQQQADPVAPLQRSLNRKGSKNSTQPITSIFSGGKVTRNQYDQKVSAPAKSLPFKAHAANNASKDVPKLNVAERRERGWRQLGLNGSR